MSNPIEQALEHIKKALELYDGAELAVSHLIRVRGGAQDDFGKLWDATIACGQAMVRASYLYGEPKDPPAKYALIAAAGGELALVALTGQVGDWIQAKSINGKPREYYLTLKADEMPVTQRPHSTIVYLTDDVRTIDGVAPKEWRKHPFDHTPDEDFVEQERPKEEEAKADVPLRAEGRMRERIAEARKALDRSVK